MISCPRCHTRLSAGVVRCGDCEADVTLLARLEEVPDSQFNQALTALARGDATTANTLAGSLLTARPTDAEGWLLMGHVQAAGRNWEGARQSWKMMSMLRPADPRPARALQSLAQKLREASAALPSPVTPAS